MAWHSYHRAWIEGKQFQKKHFQAQHLTFCFYEKSWKQLILIPKCILKLDDSKGKTLGGWIITYIRVRVRDVSWRLAHEAKAGEVVCLVLGLLILLWAGRVITGEVKVIEGSTRSRHHLLELLLHLLVLEAVLLLVVALAVVVPLGVVVLIGGWVELLPLGVVGDEVVGVASLKVAFRRSPPLLAEPVQSTESPHQ
jgi:hypothetical protein